MPIFIELTVGNEKVFINISAVVEMQPLKDGGTCLVPIHDRTYWWNVKENIREIRDMVRTEVKKCSV